MKRVLVLSMCVLLCGASSALATQYEAGWLTDVQGDVVTVNYQKSTYSSHVDEIDFTIASITGGANYIDTVAGGGTYGSAFGGLFSTAGSGYIALSTSSSLWPDYAQTNIGANPTDFPATGFVDQPGWLPDSRQS